MVAGVKAWAAAAKSMALVAEADLHEGAEPRETQDRGKAMIVAIREATIGVVGSGGARAAVSTRPATRTSGRGVREASGRLRPGGVAEWTTKGKGKEKKNLFVTTTAKQGHSDWRITYPTCHYISRTWLVTHC